jgi:rhodanese-related sulfurtransferase
MAASTQAQGKSLRVRVPDAIRRLESGQPVLVLDVRSPRAWDASRTKIQGAIRVPPGEFRIDPSWPKDRFTLVYCT